jgi:hypothetical protein
MTNERIPKDREPLDFTEDLKQITRDELDRVSADKARTWIKEHHGFDVADRNSTPREDFGITLAPIISDVEQLYQESGDDRDKLALLVIARGIAKLLEQDTVTGTVSERAEIMSKQHQAELDLLLRKQLGW